MNNPKNLLKIRKPFGVFICAFIIVTLTLTAFLGYKSYQFTKRGQSFAMQHNVTFSPKRISQTISEAEKFEKSGNIAMALTKYKEATRFGYPDFEKVKARLIKENKVDITKK